MEPSPLLAMGRILLVHLVKFRGRVTVITTTYHAVCCEYILLSRQGKGGKPIPPAWCPIFEEELLSNSTIREKSPYTISRRLVSFTFAGRVRPSFDHASPVKRRQSGLGVQDEWGKARKVQVDPLGCSPITHTLYHNLVYLAPPG